MYQQTGFIERYKFFGIIECDSIKKEEMKEQFFQISENNKILENKIVQL